MATACLRSVTSSKIDECSMPNAVMPGVLRNRFPAQRAEHENLCHLVET